MVRGDGTMGTATAHQGMDGFVGNHGRALQQNKGLPQLRCGAPVVKRNEVFMKKIIIVILSVIFTSVFLSISVQGQNIADQLELRIVSETTSYNIGAPIPISVELHNYGDTYISLPDFGRGFPGGIQVYVENIFDSSISFFPRILWGDLPVDWPKPAFGIYPKYYLGVNIVLESSRNDLYGVPENYYWNTGNPVHFQSPAVVRSGTYRITAEYANPIFELDLSGNYIQHAVSYKSNTLTIMMIEPDRIGAGNL
jgi:hypothetical protein